MNKKVKTPWLPPDQAGSAWHGRLEEKVDSLEKFRTGFFIALGTCIISIFGFFVYVYPSIIKNITILENRINQLEKIQEKKH